MILFQREIIMEKSIFKNIERVQKRLVLLNKKKSPV